MVYYYNTVIRRTITMFFAYGEKEITYLKQKDKRLAEIIDKIGRGSHKRIIFFTGNWCLDRGNDSVVLYAASKCIEFW